MRILCLTPRLPYPPNRGDRLRAFHIIEHLAADHELTLVSFLSHEAQREHVAPLEQYGRVHTVFQGPLRSAAAVAGNAWRRAPLQALYYRSRAMQRLVDGLVAATPFDAAYVHLFRMAPYLAQHAGLYRVVDLTDAISKEVGLSLPYRSLAWRLLYRLEGPRIARYECQVARSFEETWLISEADRKHLAAACPGANLRVVPNGVDTDYFRPTGAPGEGQGLIFVGHMGVPHNVDAARHLVTDILPLVRQQVPDARLYIVGADPAPQVRALEQAPGVRVTGFVPDLNEALNRAAVFVAPLRFAAGVQNKVLEAMAAGRPVVTTSVINAGLGATPGRDLLLADNAPAMAANVVRLLHDEGLREQIGRAGRQFIQERYSWQHAVGRMAEIERDRRRH
ncbi:MAG: TIGR03087 family PEP-CTERM/XrtA system glycosyltransferase [Anaerolineae bacterium]